MRNRLWPLAGIFLALALCDNRWVEARVKDAYILFGIEVNIPNSDLVDGKVLTYESSSRQLKLKTPGGGSVTMGGDITGPSSASVVSDISIITTKGDLIGGNNAGNAARIAVGVDGKVLKANSAVAGGLEWADDQTGTGTNLVSKGQVQGYDGAANQPIGPGTDGQILTADSSNANGAQFLSLNGLVTGPVTATTIANGALALAKLATEADATIVGNASGGVASPTALTVVLPLIASSSTLTTSMATAKIIGRTTAGTGTMESLAVSGGLSLGTAGTLTTSTGTTTVIGRTTAGTGAYESLAVSGGLTLGTAGTLTTSTGTTTIIGRTTAATGPYESLAVSGGLDLGTAGTLTTSTATAKIIGRTTAGTGAYEQLAVSGGLSLATAGTLTTSTGTTTIIGRTTAGTGAYESLAVSGGLSLGTAGTFTTSLNTGKIWGRTTAGTGAIEEITPNGTRFSFAAGTLDIASGGIASAQIADGSVALADMANLAATSLIGNATGSPAVPAALTLVSPLVFSGTTLTTSIATAKVVGRTTAGSGVVEQLAVSGGLDLGTAGTLTTSTATAKVIGRTTAGTGAYEQLAVSGLLSLGTAGTLTTSMSTANLVGRTTAGTGAMESLALGSGLSLATAGSFTTSIATSRLWGRTTAGTGQVEEISVGSGLTLSGGSLTSSAPAAATQAEQEAASSTTAYTSPGRQHFHPGSAKAWVEAAVGGTTINASYNVSSVSRTGAGDYTVNFTTSFSTANFCTVASANFNTNLAITDCAPTATGTMRVTISNNAGTLTDAPSSLYCAAAYGDFP